MEINGEAAAYPFGVLQQRRVLQDTVGGTPIIVFWTTGTTSALDGSSITTSRDTGATGVFRPSVDSRTLTFESRQGTIRDRETGSTWNILGHAISGPLTGKRLEPVNHGNHFWFSWAVFKPETRIVE